MVQWLKKSMDCGGQKKGGPVPDLPAVQGWPCSLFPGPQQPSLFSGTDKTIYPTGLGCRLGELLLLLTEPQGLEARSLAQNRAER